MGISKEGGCGEGNGTGPRHIVALDGLRGLAVALVVGDHFFLWWKNGYHLEPGVVFNWLGWGWCGVNIFFVLSGFLITGILLESRGKPGYYRNFYGRRTLRIFPLYFGMVIALAVLAGLWEGSDALNVFRSKEWMFFTYTYNFWPLFGHGEELAPVRRWLPHFWSLCVEEHFYLLWPFVVAVMTRSSRLLMVCGAAYLTGVLCKFGFVELGWKDAAYLSTPARFDALILGAMAAICLRTLPQRVVARASGIVVLVAALACLTVLVLEVNPGSRQAINLLFTSYAVDWLAAGLVLLLATSRSGPFSVCLAAGDQGTILRVPVGEIFSHPLLVRLGVISYGVYIFHLPIQQFFIQCIWPRLGFLRSLPSSVDFVLYAVITTAVSLAVGELSWRFFETPILSLKDRWFGKPRAAEAVPLMSKELVG